MQLAIVTDLNRCIACHTCTVACKMENNVPLGLYYIKVLRVGPKPKYQGAKPPLEPHSGLYSLYIIAFLSLISQSHE